MLLAALLAMPATAAADSRTSDLEDGPIVRRQLMHRSGRMELSPMLGVTLNDAYIRNTLVGVNAVYHINNVFGLGLTASYGLLHTDTSLRESVVAELQRVQGRDNTLANLSYSQINWAMDAGFTYVPMFGKFSVLNRWAFHYDLHMLAGLGIVGEGAVPALPNGPVAGGLEGTRPGGMLGFGFRLFANDRISANFQVRDYIFSRAQVSSGSANPQLTNTFVMSLGVGVFFPGDVRISR